MKLDRITLVGMVAMTAVSTDLYLSGIPLIVAEFNATQADGQLTLGIFMIGISLGQLIYGPLSDYYGRKPVLYVGLIAYIVASLGCLNRDSFFPKCFRYRPCDFVLRQQRGFVGQG